MMAWPVAEVSVKSAPQHPRYWLWTVILIAVMAAGTLFVLFVGKPDSYAQLLLTGTLPGALIWLIVAGIRFIFFLQSRVFVRIWNKEAAYVKSRWQQWSRMQLAVVGNVLLSPEPEGIALLLGDAAGIPLYPQPRTLSDPGKSLADYLTIIDTMIERQCPGYRNQLYSIYVLSSAARQQETINEHIFMQWDITPVWITGINELNHLYDNPEFNEVVLILCLQSLPYIQPLRSSEFVSAQLITSADFAGKQKMNIIAGLGRVMPLEQGNLDKELKMLFDYLAPDKETLNSVWISGKSDSTMRELVTFAFHHQWRLPVNQPVHYIDLSFGPPGEHAFEISLAMLVQAVSITSRDQLIISAAAQMPGNMCLITKELFS